MLTFFKKWFGPVSLSIRGFINTSELFRALVTSLVAGGGAATILSTLHDNARSIFRPQDIGVATTAILLVLEVFRRISQGEVVVRRTVSGLALEPAAKENND
jgi:hypothetical protein